MKIAVYPGTFDPITRGHIDILKTASRMFDKVILAVAEASAKNTLFTTDERTELCRQSCSDIQNIEVMKFSGLVVDFAESVEATTMIRGLRAVSDFEYELSLALMNKNLKSTIDTVFLLPSHDFLYLSSSIVKQVIKLGASIDKFVIPEVRDALREKYNIQEK